MADHVRRQLREAVAAALTPLATTGTRVFQGRVQSIERASLPCLVVYTSDEQVEIAQLGEPPVYQRDIQVEVHGLADALANLDDTLDQIGKEVEAALSASITVGGGPITLELQSVEITFDEESETPTGRIGHVFQARLHTVANAPDVVLDR